MKQKHTCSYYLHRQNSQEFTE